MKQTKNKAGSSKISAINLTCPVKEGKLISGEEIEQYYKYLLKAFEEEFEGISNRLIMEEATSKSVFSSQDELFFRSIVENAFHKTNPYKKPVPLYKAVYQHPLELIDYIVMEGYTPTSPFIFWVHKHFKVTWDPLHWFHLIMRSIAPVDIAAIRQEFNRQVYTNTLPETLEFYYRLGTGLENVKVDPDLGIRDTVRFWVAKNLISVLHKAKIRTFNQLIARS
jgi:hypothetical protein